MIGKAIYGILANDVAVSSKVGSRIFPNAIKTEERLPALIYEIENIDPSNTKNGVSKLDIANVQITCLAETFTLVDDLTENVKRALDYVSSNDYGVNIQHISFLNQSDMFNENWGQRGVAFKTITFKVRKIN